MRGTIIYDGLDLSKFGVYYDGSKEYEKPSKEMNRISIPGRNGDIFLPNNRWSNVPIPYDCYIRDDFQANYNSLVAFLNSRKGYKVLETSGQPDVYRMAAFLSAIAPDMGQLNRKGKFTLEFDCMPQRFLKSGTVTQEITGGSGTIMNPTAFASSPLLTVYGSGTIGINDDVITITNDALGYMKLTDRITLAVGATKSVNVSGLFNAGDYITYNSGYVTVKVRSDTNIQSANATFNGALAPDVHSIAASGKVITLTFSLAENQISVPSSGKTSQSVSFTISFLYSDNTSGTVSGAIVERVDADADTCSAFTSFTSSPGTHTVTYECSAVINGISGLSTVGGSYPFMIDLESLKSYKEINGSVVSLNHLVDFGIDAPTLKPGTNAITSDTYPSTQVDIVPRWWTL